jgi:prevent-host-death family protein
MIRPSSDLRNHYNEISEYCHSTQQPVHITKNGRGDVVVLSEEEYARFARQELYRKIEEGLEDVRMGRTRPAEAVFAELELTLERLQ